MQQPGIQAVAVAEEAVAVGPESGRRLTQLSLTPPAPSLLSTSASDPFSDTSRSGSEEGGESVLSFSTVAGASGGVGAGAGAGTGAGAGGGFGVMTDEDADADADADADTADARFRDRVL
jgi:hypothetical protein